MTLTVRTAVPLLVTLGLLAVDALPAGAAEADEIWERARGAGVVAHSGEIVAVTHVDGAQHRTRLAVEGAGGLTLPTGDGLGRKYRLETAGEDVVLDRPATRLEVYGRHDEGLRERIWVDDATGLVLRRERYDGETLAVLVAYERLELAPIRTAASGRPGRSAIDADVPLPAELPGGYRLTGPATLSGAHQAVRVAYDDGLYRVSVFAQPGRLDARTLPPGARRVDGFPGPAYDWPGAFPQRLVWEAGGTTWTIVGDAPPPELAALALALPQPQRPAPLRRLRTGLTRVWSSLSPFG